MDELEIYCAGAFAIVCGFYLFKWALPDFSFRTFFQTSSSDPEERLGAMLDHGYVGVCGGLTLIGLGIAAIYLGYQGWTFNAVLAWVGQHIF